MKIRSIDLYPFSIPLKKPLVWADGRQEVLDWIVVKITGEDGTYGVSEAINRHMIYGETQASIYYAIKHIIAPLLIGMDSFNLERIWEKMNAIKWNPEAKSAIDVALHDLNGKIMGVPIYQMLGGPYRDKVEVCWMVGLDTNEKMLEEMKQKVSEGYKSFKVKGGIDPENDIIKIKYMRENLPRDVKIYVDANCRYDREVATRVLRELDGYLDAIEEPMNPDDSIGRLQVSQQTGVPFLGDESVFTVASVYRELQLGALKRVSIKVPRTGFYLASKMVHLCEAANVKMQICTQSETDLGTVACLHLAAAYKQICFANEIIAYQDAVDGILKNEITFKDGYMELMTGPGLGVEVDWDKVKYYSNEIIL
ncbi:MAG: mandelate racemase/muconate lactonizing enzyme family protein [Firmicutes bacterium]|nr:mandelate racemase/muconate lactonizing enzyme family protein [Bacillota bacterium]